MPQTCVGGEGLAQSRDASAGTMPVYEGSSIWSAVRLRHNKLVEKNTPKYSYLFWARKNNSPKTSEKRIELKSLSKEEKQRCDQRGW